MALRPVMSSSSHSKAVDIRLQSKFATHGILGRTVSVCPHHSVRHMAIVPNGPKLGQPKIRELHIILIVQKYAAHRHELINEQPLVAIRVVADQVDEVWVVEKAKHENFHYEFMIPLKAFQIELLHCNNLITRKSADLKRAKRSLFYAFG
ncbi:E3 ubiquitin-protein ligase UBR5 [Striga asiatica]|uniref:E3 ubiquitin-protein ligase UBR5 n=1 Tax=Striga asiatica TaxID=4170 RepID=A0A5A7QWG8_STRAF|nr:E3 ubiquitin-protein ligase UBR5 [Striga asiatica]